MAGSVQKNQVVALDGHGQERPLIEKAVAIVQLLQGVSYKEWQAIEAAINQEYRRLANLNVFAPSPAVIANIKCEIQL